MKLAGDDTCNVHRTVTPIDKSAAQQYTMQLHCRNIHISTDILWQVFIF